MARESAVAVNYYDEMRTHEVAARLDRRGNGLFLRIDERPFESASEDETLTREHALATPMAAQFAIHELEERLAATGAQYYRLDPQTRRVDALPAALSGVVDLRYHEVEVPGDDARPFVPLRVHHFHRRDGVTRLDMSLPRLDVADERYVLATVEFAFPDPNESTLKIVHPRLAPGTLRHQWVDTHIDLPKSGFRKLVTDTDYSRTFGDGWERMWRNAVQGSFYRLLEESEKALAVAEEPALAFQGDLITALERAFESKLVDRVRATHLAPGEDDRLIAAGEIEIRRWVQNKRRAATPDEQHHLSLVEATLLVQYAVQEARQKLLENEGRRVIRMVNDAERGRVPMS